MNLGEPERALVSASPHIKCLPWPRMKQRVRDQELGQVSHRGGRNPVIWAITTASRVRSSSKLELEAGAETSSLDSSERRSGCHRR